MLRKRPIGQIEDNTKRGGLSFRIGRRDLFLHVTEKSSATGDYFGLLV